VFFPYQCEAFWFKSRLEHAIDETKIMVKNETNGVIQSFEHAKKSMMKIGADTKKEFKKHIEQVHERIEMAENKVKETVDSVHEKIEEARSTVKNLIAEIWFWCKIILGILAVLFLLGTCGIGYYYYRKFTFYIFGMTKTMALQNAAAQKENTKYVCHHVNMIEQVNAILPYIHVKLNGIGVTALFDSAASVSLCRISVARELFVVPEPCSDNTKAFAANGTEMTFMGRIKVRISIGKFTELVEFLVTDDVGCPAPILIGTDVIERMNEAGFDTAIDIANKMVKIGGTILKFVCALTNEEKLAEESVFQNFPLRAVYSRT
jgi:hypothetical protein